MPGLSWNINFDSGEGTQRKTYTVLIYFGKFENCYPVTTENGLMNSFEVKASTEIY